MSIFNKALLSLAVITAATILPTTIFGAWYDQNKSDQDPMQHEKMGEEMHKTDAAKMEDEQGQLSVAIDIQPSDALNKIDLKSDQDVEIAILGSDNFDVNNVNSQSLTFGDAVISSVPRVIDVNNDGLSDLVFASATGKLNLKEGENTLKLKGATKDGKTFEGTDTINVTDSK